MLCRAAREILVPCPGIKPGPRRWKHQLSLNPGTTRDALNNFRFTEKLSYRAESSCTLLHSPPQVPLLPAFAVVWESCYKWHTITDTLLEFTLLVLCILWVLINVWRRGPLLPHLTEQSHCPETPLCSACSSLPPSDCRQPLVFLLSP